MLTDRDRTLLAPHLALLRSAKSELAAARRALADAEQQAGESRTGTDWRDRLLGGLLSVDEGRARRFREGRRARKEAEATMEAATRRYEKYATRMDGLLEPILRRDDPAFRGILAAINECDRALRACEQTRDRIRSGLAKPAPAPRRSGSEPDTPAWHEAEFARRRFDELAAEVQRSVPRLSRAMTAAAKAVTETSRGRPLTPVRLDTSALNRRGSAAEKPLRALQHELEAAITEITAWRGRAGDARTAALRAAEETL